MSLRHLIALPVVLLAGSAAAEPLSVWINQSKTMTLSVKVAKVSVDDGSVLSAKVVNGGVQLKGKTAGRTEIHVRTTGGDTFSFPVHVTSEGGTVYSMNRTD